MKTLATFDKWTIESKSTIVKLVVDMKAVDNGKIWKHTFWLVTPEFYDSPHLPNIEQQAVFRLHLFHQFLKKFGIKVDDAPLMEITDILNPLIGEAIVINIE